MEFLFTKDVDWLSKWDHYVQTNDRGSHLLLSDWLNSYETYNFDYEVCIVLHKGEIVGGFGAVIAKALFLKFYIIPYGPIVSVGFEKELNALIQHVVNRATFHKSCYCHITLPLASYENPHVMAETSKLEFLTTASSGHLFHHVYSSSGLNWVDLKKYASENHLLTDLKLSPRRYIRKALKNNLIVKAVTHEHDIESAYQICIENAKSRKYSVREWRAIKDTLIHLIQKNHAKFLVASSGNVIKGSLLIIKAGNHFTYILGGTQKEKPDLYVGHLLHWEAIKLSFQKGYDGYNISLGGSVGVQRFKSGFNSESVYFQGSKHHWILNPFYFKIYLFFKVNLKKHKHRIGSFLTVIKRKHENRK
ncbi:lipid II:glycine glycyltransferase FemX [Flavobacterium succinicans]|uniref:FemAB family protein n=1 Tax=Flavobacterium succinicans TaxID=29536 RepID=A0A199XUS1_9FLAO|nr:peptidoglycan bridge formation glycyltransferase FemA/FemB family protein [Flavobacterium succinicans]OAZ05395.1 FemAB family protein [Flavobacterium succinicans]